MSMSNKDFFDILTPRELDEILPDDFDASLSKAALKRIEKKALRSAGLKAPKLRLTVILPAACIALAAGVGWLALSAISKNRIGVEYVGSSSAVSENSMTSGDESIVQTVKTKHSDREISFIDFTDGTTRSDKVKCTELSEFYTDFDKAEELMNSDTEPYYGNDDTLYYVDKGYAADNNNVTDDKSWNNYVIVCKQQDEILWTVKFPTLGKDRGDDELSIELVKETDAGAAVIGQVTHWNEVTESSLSHSSVHGFVTRIDKDGNKLWTHNFDHGFNDEYVLNVVDNGTSWTVISACDEYNICVTKLDLNGNELKFAISEPGFKILHADNAVKLDNGYLVQLSTDEGTRLVRLSDDGDIVDVFAYRESDGYDYTITDIVKSGDKIYLSSYYEIPYPENSVSSYAESANQLTSMLVESTAAVLLICDADSGQVTSCVWAPAVYSRRLEITDSGIIWDIEKISGVSFFPYADSFNTSIKCRVYRCTFDNNNELINCEDTGKYNMVYKVV